MLAHDIQLQMQTEYQNNAHPNHSLLQTVTPPLPMLHHLLILAQHTSPTSPQPPPQLPYDLISKQQQLKSKQEQLQRIELLLLKKQLLMKELADLRLQRFQIEESVSKTKLCIEHVRKLSVREGEIYKSQERRSRSVQEQQAEHIKATNHEMKKQNSSLVVYARHIQHTNCHLKSHLTRFSSIKAQTQSSQLNSSLTSKTRTRISPSYNTFTQLPKPHIRSAHLRSDRLRTSNTLLRQKYPLLK